MAAQLLEAMRLPKGGVLTSLSDQLARVLCGSRFQKSLVCPRGHLEGAVVLVPVYRSGPRPRWNVLPDARLSLISLMAVWRAGGVVAPVTPKLLQPRSLPQDPEPVRWIAGGELLPVALTQWQPAVVLSFGELEEVLLRMLMPGSLWSLRQVQHLRPALQVSEGKRKSKLLPTAPTLPLAAPGVTLSAPAVMLSCGLQLTFDELLSALEDPSTASALGGSVESTLLELMQAAQVDATAAGRGIRHVGSQPWWSVAGHESSVWPPKRLPKRPVSWTPLVDSATGFTYFWNQETGVTTWEAPSEGRRSWESVRRRSSHIAAALAESSAEAVRRQRQTFGAANSSSRRRRRGQATDAVQDHVPEEATPEEQLRGCGRKRKRWPWIRPGKLILTLQPP